MAGEELNAKKMKVSELRDALKERGLPTDGLKGDLVNRLEAYLEEQEFALPGEEESTPATAAKTTVEEPPVPAPTLDEPAAAEETPKPAEETAPVSKEAPAPKEVTPAADETEKEAATPGTEPAPAPVVPEPTAAKPTSEMSFAEKKAARAARFGIAVVEPKKPNNAGGKKNKDKKRQSNDGKKQQQSNKKQKKGESTKEKKKNEPPKKKEQPLLSVEEIEKRLKRAEKFGTGDSTQTAELKAMLRKHRFATTSS